MTLEISVSGKESRTVVSVYNAATAAAISSGEAVILTTGTTPNIYSVTRIGATAGTVVRVFGVCEKAIATGQIGPCVIHGPAKAMSAAAHTVKSPMTAQYGTTGVRGRAAAATAGTAGIADDGAYLGWAMKVGSTAAFTEVFVDTAHCNIA